MKTIKIDYNNPKIEPILEAIDVLNCGGIVIFPTDTVYGLAVNILRDDAIEKLFTIKKRPSSKPVPIMVRDIEMAKKFAFIDRKIEKILNDVWPGQVTVILGKRKDISEKLTSGRRTVGLRISDCKIVKLLLENIDYPITATSANISGESPIIQSAEIMRVFENRDFQPDLFLDAGNLKNSSPSTVLDLTSDKPKILRVGPVTKKDLLNILR